MGGTHLVAIATFYFDKVCKNRGGVAIALHTVGELGKKSAKMSVGPWRGSPWPVNRLCRCVSNGSLARLTMAPKPLLSGCRQL